MTGFLDQNREKPKGQKVDSLWAAEHTKVLEKIKAAPLRPNPRFRIRTEQTGPYERSQPRRQSSEALPEVLTGGATWGSAHGPNKRGSQQNSGRGEVLFGGAGFEHQVKWGGGLVVSSSPKEPHCPLGQIFWLHILGKPSMKPCRRKAGGVDVPFQLAIIISWHP